MLKLPKDYAFLYNVFVCFIVLQKSGFFKMRKIIIGMSGGVDSSVVGLLLSQQNIAIEALFMKNWEEDDTENYCSAAEDLQDAQTVCDVLKIPLHTVNFASEYWDNVFAHCLQEYQAGRTPNPDVLCNREIKFKVFLQHAINLGGDAIATGHYARKIQVNGCYKLLKGIDSTKDQSYFLYMLNQAQLAKSYFPLGELSKAAVRKLAEQADLVTKTKKDSTGICFIGERPFKEFLQRFLTPQPGLIETPAGEHLGKHDGLMFYTLGQRKGLNIGGQKDKGGEPWYVVDKDIENNRLIVAQGHNHPLLFSSNILVKQNHWISGITPQMPLSCYAKTRYRQTDQSCVVSFLETDIYQVKFTHPQRAVTPGQSVVFYQGDECLGGAIIESIIQ
ncbi:MAG: tRNA 2-thiouridine(34) synthase MnmA [Candidatus Marithrix sp.]|nr:tRNA 2-thiouridine(34) synthase MnmA [Candidatus Marithrix sp.]